MLGNYKESLEYSHKCEKAAAVTAYRDITEKMSVAENMTYEGFSSSADIMEVISDYKDARELARIYRLKASALAYNEAIAIFEKSESSIDDWERAVYLLSKIKSYKNSRELYDRYFGHYAQKRYEQATEVLNRAGTNAECMLACELFLKISTYSDAARQAEAAKKKAQKYKVSPRQIQKEDKKKVDSQRVKKSKGDNLGNTTASILIIKSILKGYIDQDVLTKTAQEIDALISTENGLTNHQSIIDALKKACKNLTTVDLGYLARLIISAVNSINKP